MPATTCLLRLIFRIKQYNFYRRLVKMFSLSLRLVQIGILKIETEICKQILFVTIM